LPQATFDDRDNRRKALPLTPVGGTVPAQVYIHALAMANAAAR